MSTPNWRIRARDANLCIRNFIDGRYVDVSPGEKLIVKYAPRDGSLLYQFGAGDRADVAQAVSSARQAFDDGRWKNLPMQQRKAVLQKLTDLVGTHQEETGLV